MDFIRLDILHITPIILFIAVIIWIVFGGRGGDVSKDESKNYTFKAFFSHIRLASLIISIVLLIVAFFGPISSLGTNDNERQGIDIVWVLDVSKSMDVQDVTEGEGTISRLAGAKKIIESYMVVHPENRYGLAIFAGQARLVSPLTSESDSILTFLTSIDTSSIADGGTNFREALNIAVGRLSNTESHPLSLILLSDGGDQEDLGDTTMIAGPFTGKNITLTTVGIGSDTGGPIPTGQDIFGNATFKLFDGEMVTSRLEPDTLKSLARIGKGSYISGDDIGPSLDATLAKTIRHSVIGSMGSSGDSGRVLVMVASIFFLLFLLIPASFLKKGNE